jgi:ubiquinone/menaquinone biosynthesis C-methylase UbiE
MEWASFGPHLQRCRCAFLPLLADCRHALVLGDGDGRFTARLLSTNLQVQIEAVDASSAMLNELIHRAGPNAGRIRTQCADVRNWQPAANGYDLIVSHFLLDCFTTSEIEQLAETIRHAAAPSAVWVISEFAVPANTFGRFLAGPLVAGLYAAFGLLTGLKNRKLPNHRKALRSSDFHLCEERRWLRGLLVSELWKIAPL